MIAVFTWWGIIQLFGLAALPILRRVFAWLPDRGYAFSKTAGLLLVAYLFWVGASAGLLVNTSGGILLALLVVGGVAGLAYASGSQRPLRERLKAFWQEQKFQVLFTEALFLATFAGWAVVRAYAPDKILPAGGEKYMEIAFLNGVLNSPRFPPLDPWLSGYAISYYYFGYIMMALMTRLSGIAPTIGFDLYDALLFALTAITAYGVVSNLVRVSLGSPRASHWFGLLGALFVGGLGNLEGLLEGVYSARLLPAAFWQWIDIPDLAGSAQSGLFYPGSGWWWWRGSRVLRDLDLFYKPVVYPPIDEFPFFSFLLGDNHPHKLGLPFVILAIGLALNLLLKQSAKPTAPRSLSGEGLFYLFYAIALGGLAFLNTWDFPIYLGLVVLAYLAGSALRPVQESVKEEGQSLKNLLLRSLGLGAGLGLGSILLYIFFYLGFSSQAGGVLPYVFPPTRLAQYFVMFGVFLGILSFFIITALRRTALHGSALRAMLRTWLLLVGVIYAAYLFALLLGLAAMNTQALKGNSIIQSMLGGLNPGEALLRILGQRVADPWLFLVLSALIAAAVVAVLQVIRNQAGHEDPASAGLSFGLILAVTGLMMTLIVEFFYLRDNFGMRMNTIFKFYFQGWVMMACASAYGAWWLSQRAGRGTRRVFVGLATLLVAAGLVYPLMGIASRDNGFRGAPSMDAAASFAGFYPGHWAAQPDDWAAIQWLVQNGRLPDGSVPVILEASSVGYENGGRISAFTGYPTLLGWINHEGQWRGSQVQISQRAPVVSSIYTNPSPDLALSELRQWNVRFVIVGEAERQYAARICSTPGTTCDPNRALGKFNQILTLVFEQGSTRVYQVPESSAP